jgi:peptide/nickel transport system substrate-binding protein
MITSCRAPKITMDQERRKELAARLQHYYADEMTQIPLYNMDTIQPYSAKYEGWTHCAYRGIMCPETFYNLRRAGGH